jgi:mono/diheme cytochrome c family protein
VESKTNKYIALVALGAFVLLVIVFAAMYVLNRDYPEPKALDALNGSLEQGEYLARAGNCYACHTSDERQPFAGGVAFKTDFGTLYSTNITPDPESGLGEWQFKDFYRAMKYGVGRMGQHLYPAFPYTDFAKLTDDDIASLFLFVQDLKPISANAKANELRFPYNQRILLAGWKWLFHDAQTFEPNMDSSEEWNRGAYLVEGPGHCGACHTPRNILGAEKEAWALSGGIQEDKTKLGHYRRWSSVNLTSADTGLASWSKTDIAAFLKTGKNPLAIVHGPMREVVMHSSSYLTEQDLLAMAEYIKSLPAKSPPSGSEGTAEQLAEGEIVYTVHCGSCHLPTGLGSEGLGVTLHQNPIVQAADPASLINVILYGPHLPGPPFPVDRSPMKMFGKRLSDIDIAAVSTYLRANFNNKAGAVSPEQVKVQR